MNEERPWKCRDCGERFAEFTEFYAHKIHIHGFKPTTHSHTMRFWRRSVEHEVYCQHCGGLLN